MKSLRFLPLTFLAGTHGFALFAPYVAFALVVLGLARHMRGRRVAMVAVAVPVGRAIPVAG